MKSQSHGPGGQGPVSDLRVRDIPAVSRSPLLRSEHTIEPELSFEQLDQESVQAALVQLEASMRIIVGRDHECLERRDTSAETR